MRLDEARLAPLDLDEMPKDIVEMFGDTPPRLNIFRTIAHHPELMKPWMVFGGHILGQSTLSPRDREIAILRVGSRCRSGYEWSQHVRIALGVGLSEEEIPRIHDGSAGEGWSDAERAILDATDELVADAFITDPTWKRLSAHYDTQQLMDLIFTVGQYNLVSMALNTLGVQLEDDASRLAPPPRD